MQILISIETFTRKKILCAKVSNPSHQAGQISIFHGVGKIHIKWERRWYSPSDITPPAICRNIFAIFVQFEYSSNLPSTPCSTNLELFEMLICTSAPALSFLLDWSTLASYRKERHIKLHTLHTWFDYKLNFSTHYWLILLVKDLEGLHWRVVL